MKLSQSFEIAYASLAKTHLVVKANKKTTGCTVCRCDNDFVNDLHTNKLDLIYLDCGRRLSAQSQSKVRH